MDLLHTIDTLSHLVPLTRQRVETMFGITLAETGGNDKFLFLTADAGVKLELRVRKSTETAELLVVLPGPVSITRQEVLARFEGLAVTSRPRGRSLEETTDYGRTTASGSLSFGFKEGSPDTLAVIALSPAQGR